MALTLLLLGLLYFLAHALSLAFSRTRIPDVLELMAVGILVGPILRFVSPATFGSVGPVLTTITLAAILFESGTSLDLKTVAGSARSTLVLALVSSGVTIAVVAPLAVALAGLSWGAAFLTGAIVCGTSSAVVIPMVASLRMGPEPGTVLILESALTDVLCIVLTFGLLQAQTQGGVHVGQVVGQTLASLTFAAVIGVAGAAAWLRIWDWVRRMPATIFATLAWALVLYGTAELLGFSGAIAVLSLGLALRNHDTLRLDLLFRNVTFTAITDMERRFYSEVVFLLKTFFFVYLGISMRFDTPKSFAIAAAIVAAIYLGRLVVTSTLLARRHRRLDAAIVSVMVPKGLAAAVLAGLPLQAGVVGGAEIQGLVYAIVFISITLTAVLVGLCGTPRAQPIIARLFARFAE